MTETAQDGRVARGQRTRAAVIDALYELYAEGNYTPTIQEIATRVGTTTRSIYHHFPDRDAVADALAEQQMERHPELFAARPITGTRTERIGGIVAHRAELFETIAPTRRAALALLHLIPALQVQQSDMAAHLRRQLARTFDEELTVLDRGARADALDLIDLHTSWDTWNRLRVWQSLSLKRSRQLITGLVERTLDP